MAESLIVHGDGLVHSNVDHEQPAFLPSERVSQLDWEVRHASDRLLLL
jgi:hypothetical protein